MAPSSSSVDARLDDLHLTAALLNGIADDCETQVNTVAGIEWNLPLEGDALAPVTSYACATQIQALTFGTKSLMRLAVDARLHAQWLTLSALAYELAESSAQMLVESVTMPINLQRAAALVAEEYAEDSFHGRGFDANHLQSKHPEIVDLATKVLAGILPFDYTHDMDLLYGVGIDSGGPSAPVTTRMTTSPASANKAPEVRSVADAMGRVPALYENAKAAGHIQVQRVVDPHTGQGAWTVMLPGTSTWTWNASNPFDLTGNLMAQGRLDSGPESAAVDAVKQAMAKEGVSDRREPVMVIGHSQGGIVAMNMARHDTGLNIKKVVTFGSPVGRIPVAPGCTVLNIENSVDVVPRLDAGATGDGEKNRTRVVLEDPGSTTSARGSYDPIEAHSAGRYHRDYEIFREHPSAPVDAFEKSARPFFTGTAHNYTFDSTRQAPAPPTQVGLR